MNIINNKILELKEFVRNNPLEFNARIELVQYYCLNGMWSDAQKTFSSYLKLNSKDDKSKIIFKNNIICELKRLEVFNDNIQPSYFEDDNSEEYEIQRKILNNIDVIEIDHFFRTHDLLENDAVEFNIQLNNGNNIQGGFKDTDHRTHLVLEIFFEEEYKWVSTKNIKDIEFYDNQYLTDLIWRRAVVTLKSGFQIPCFLPVRYCHENLNDQSDQLKQSLFTEWFINSNGYSIASGQKTFEVLSDIDVGILDIKKISV